MKLCQNFYLHESKSRSRGQILENHVYILEGTVLIQYSWIYVKMFVTMKKGLIWKWVKTMSLGQILKNQMYTLEGIVLIQSAWNFFKMFVTMKSRISLKLGQKVGH